MKISFSQYFTNIPVAEEVMDSVDVFTVTHWLPLGVESKGIYILYKCTVKEHRFHINALKFQTRGWIFSVLSS